MYPESMLKSLNAIEHTRDKRLKEVHKRLTPKEIETVLQKHHPDYKVKEKKEIKIGANKGDKAPREFVELLEAHSRITPEQIDLKKIDYDVDVLVIGGGGAGSVAALFALENGADVIIATKLRHGDANTMMAQGGIQAADKQNDSPMLHYVDVMGGGHFTNNSELVRRLVLDAPQIIKWHEELGVMYDKETDGTMKTQHGGGTCRKRMHSCRDYTGVEIMRVLRDEARNKNIPVIEFSPVVELILDEKRQCAGAVLFNLETEEYVVVRAKSTIIATGGFGRLHIQGFPTTNHYGATADGIVIAYRAGAKFCFMDSVQYHPTGVAYPEQILGLLITEKVRSLGAHLVNKDGNQFVYPLETRDVVSAAIIQECYENDMGVVTPTGMRGVWLDTPMIDIRHGEGTTKKFLPAMYRQFNRFGIDLTKEPVVTYPTLHYQNGGLVINDKCETGIKNLYAAGEVSGGVHGRNRLMGNSLLDVNVFGRIAGINAALNAKKAKLGKLTLEHVAKYEKMLERAGIKTDRVAPMILPDYRWKV